MEAVEFVRLSDGPTHRFEREGEEADGRPVYRRADGVVRCRWLEGVGWCVVDGEGLPNGWPLAGSPPGAATPPAGRWRSAKAGRSPLSHMVPAEGRAR
ncbi:hypothetical protein [Pseudonocardia sp. ICBG1293]|uniref:hypothetical protein n=1 Tax=Pseudonocardia sp. ICBG1293 TaxID=2844382 RepID=UPI001CCEA45B|nr:hypothetical protein [Pseudonocardia sp. ICBG1293]